MWIWASTKQYDENDEMTDIMTEAFVCSAVEIVEKSDRHLRDLGSLSAQLGLIFGFDHGLIFERLVWKVDIVDLCWSPEDHGHSWGQSLNGNGEAGDSTVPCLNVVHWSMMCCSKVWNWQPEWESCQHLVPYRLNWYVVSLVFRETATHLDFFLEWHWLSSSMIPQSHAKTSDTIPKAHKEPMKFKLCRPCWGWNSCLLIPTWFSALWISFIQLGW